MSEEPDCLDLFGKAISEAQPGLIYVEAKRQFEALQRAQRVRYGNAVFARVTRQQIDVSKYYCSLFENVTTSLDELTTTRLLHVCFAYKTKARILRFLDLLDVEEFPWATRLLRIVRDFGRDSAFDAAEKEETEPDETSPAGSAIQHVAKRGSPHTPSANREDVNQLTRPPSAYQLLTGRRSPSIKQKLIDAMIPPPPKPAIFIIPTLPIAYPTAFFSALVTQGSASLLTVPHLLSHPAACGLALSRDLKSQLRTNLPHFWKPTLPPAGTASAATVIKQQNKWMAFFEHLLQGRAPLVPYKGELDMDYGGYSEMDLSLWIAGWAAERTQAGNAEKGREIRRSIRRSGAGARDDGGDSRVGGLQHEDGDCDVEELVDVEEGRSTAHVEDEGLSYGKSDQRKEKPGVAVGPNTYAAWNPRRSRKRKKSAKETRERKLRRASDL